MTAVIAVLFFAWELGALRQVLPSFPRPPALPWEIMFTGMLGFMLSINVGLIGWQRRYGHCPRGVKRVSGFAGAVGAITLICPACILLPASLIGVGFFFVFIGPYLPFLRFAAILLLLASAWMLRPKGKIKKKK